MSGLAGLIGNATNTPREVARSLFERWPASPMLSSGRFAFEISPSTGTLKETAQRGQERIWIR
jgi:hypothetical protein